jgi:hypothetical protein
MIKKTVNRFRWFWAWQDEKEEAWLAELARKGLHLQSVSPFGFYHFRQGEPGDYVFRLDFQPLKAQDRESYLQLFEDAGWDHVGDLGGWVYFRHEIDGAEIPEIYSDQESKIGKYQRVLAFLVIFLPVMIVVMPNAARLEYFGPIPAAILEGLRLVLLLLFSYAILMLINRISKLKKQAKTD